jgi:hypothetical protein
MIWHISLHLLLFSKDYANLGHLNLTRFHVIVKKIVLKIARKQLIPSWGWAFPFTVEEGYINDLYKAVMAIFK